jgi:hypothetical protein
MLSQRFLTAALLTSPRLAHQLISQSATYVLSTDPRPVPPGAIATELYTSYADFRKALFHGQIPTGTRAVAYDPEHWARTPSAEQRSPLHYMMLFAAAARRHGYRSILMPGRDLLLAARGSCAKRPGEVLDQAFVRCGIARAARYASVFVIQAAPVETNGEELASLVARTSDQARRANPDVKLLITLSTVCGNRPVAPAVLSRALQSTSRYVNGVDLNVSSSSTAVAESFLHRLVG